MRPRGSVPMLAMTVVLAMILVVSGCGQPDSGSSAGDGVVVLAKAEGWRDGLQDAAGHPYILMEVASDPGTAGQAWADNVPESLPEADGEPAGPGVYGVLDAVDFDDQVVVVFSSGQSSSCPVWVQSVSTSDGRVAINLASAAEADEACTDDFQPYRLVLAVDRDRLPPEGDLPVDTIDVPSENLEGVEGRVVVYPAR